MSDEFGAEMQLRRLVPGLPMEAVRRCAAVVVGWRPPDERETEGHGCSCSLPVFTGLAMLISGFIACVAAAGQRRNAHLEWRSRRPQSG